MISPECRLRLVFVGWLTIGQEDSRVMLPVGCSPHRVAVGSKVLITSRAEMNPFPLVVLPRGLLLLRPSYIRPQFFGRACSELEGLALGGGARRGCSLGRTLRALGLRMRDYKN